MPRDVSGTLSANNSMKTVRAMRIEMDRVIFSPGKEIRKHVLRTHSRLLCNSHLNMRKFSSPKFAVCRLAHWQQAEYSLQCQVKLKLYCLDQLIIVMVVIWIYIVLRLLRVRKILVFHLTKDFGSTNRWILLLNHAFSFTSFGFS